MIKHAINQEMPVIVERDHHFGGKQYIFTFRNGYGLSVVPEFEMRKSMDEFINNDPYQMKPIKDLYECAVLFDEELCYDTHITDDVIRKQQLPDIHRVLRQVQEL